jgi:hypothetical protein
MLVPQRIIQKNAVQRHGFVFEFLMQKIYMEPSVTHPTNAKYDIPDTLNCINPGVNVSIKTSVSPNCVCMGDALRIFESTGDDFKYHMTVAFLKQINDKEKEIQNIYEIDLTNSRDILFKDITKEDIEELNRRIKTVPQKQKPTEQQKSHMYTYRNELHKKRGGIHLDIKCNSQQSRLQCSLPKFQHFIKYNPSIVLFKSEEKDDSLIFRGHKIDKIISSGRRVFRK